jgi:hypothetical protein
MVAWYFMRGLNLPNHGYRIAGLILKIRDRYLPGLNRSLQIGATFGMNYLRMLNPYLFHGRNIVCL